MSEHGDSYQVVTDTIVAAMENAGRWRRPWITGLVGDRPRNVRGTAYKGINYVLLSAIRARAGYATNTWGTYKAWAEIGGQVRKGEKGSPCVFWKFIRVREDDGEKVVPLARLYSVFNLAQVDGVTAARFEAAAPRPTPEGLDALVVDALDYAARERVRIVGDDPDRAFYHTLTDYINMPPAGSFATATSYASTLLHECAHSTGHASRLNRTFGGRFGDQAYAMEELVAELAAAMALSGGGHEYEPQHAAAYLNNWLTVLRGDKKAIFTAASQAEKAADRILHGVEVTETVEQPEQVAA